ncbi:helix-turn-helix domain-containing protein [Micromonospora sp. NBC_00362]|uniref:helix-turn-helix domain-containing protein n=1 Tax=Micromonospora sp. NBC_00362 TaxID=2975975 RepID=UPI002253FB7A|nr:helix-turn-helix domain-containing protein [Micromonospora sp. NBC_00362]MCX5119249.1 helix-turn-helix domain-containing protein [Micromonospora sp. NBC_00362]
MFGNETPEIPESGDVTPPSRLLYPVSEVAVLLGISEKQVGRYIERKELRSRKLGRRRLVHRDDIDAFIRDHAAVDAA